MCDITPSERRCQRMRIAFCERHPLSVDKALEDRHVQLWLRIDVKALCVISWACLAGYAYLMVMLLEGVCEVLGSHGGPIVGM